MIIPIITGLALLLSALLLLTLIHDNEKQINAVRSHHEDIIYSHDRMIWDKIRGLEKKIDMLYDHLDLRVTTTPQKTEIVSAWKRDPMRPGGIVDSYTQTMKAVLEPVIKEASKRISPLTGKPVRKYNRKKK